MGLHIKMKKYRLLGDIMLSFIIDDEQKDFRIGKEEAEKYDAYLESDGTTVWYIAGKEQKRRESITTANVIDFALKNEKIEEMP